MTSILLFVICAALLLGAMYLVWRYWDHATSRSPEEEAYDKRVAQLNERQANRLSDEQLTKPVNEDDAWRIMVERGRKTTERRNRYGGDLKRRTRERQRP
ncbi:MAG: hypothetical protein HC828_06090 [Blastochloris sp.]|nr:hypothetical protein [Blastochloris sp.]